MLLKLLFLICLSYIASSKNVTCLDRQGEPVSWFTLMKYPGNVSTNGSHHGYFDPNQGSSFQVINEYADSRGEAIPNTINLINSIPEKDFSLLVFNDEPPGVPFDPYGGHAKGFIAYDNSSKTGVYIMHSFPKFPSVNATTGYISPEFPSNTFMYGQNAYCISITEESLGHLMANLPVEWPNAYYASGVFESMATNSTDMSAVSQFDLIDGEEQWYLTKSPNTTLFLYEGIIGPYFQTNLAVESWGRPYQNPDCPPTSTNQYLNIDRVAFSANDTWDHYSDHSKWTVSVDDTLKLSCLCDMNRMDSQDVRGGSCLCSRNENLYKAMTGIIVSTDKCSNNEDEALIKAIEQEVLHENHKEIRITHESGHTVIEIFD